MEKINALNNIEIDEKGEYALFSVNPKIYPLDLVYSASYIMIDKAFIILDGDPKEKILVEIRKKKPEQDLKTLVREFNEELLNYAVYKVQSEKNKHIREMILQRVLLTNHPDYIASIAPQKNEDEAIEDPENIMKKWEST
ncbi:hypothetical protein KY345_00360 [Candidatus Woesearchaeota archaeon]|nr:hypothetical protein [Candidatus Woesearchaeota archaeon]